MHRWPWPIRLLFAGSLLIRSLGFAYSFLSYRMAELGYSVSTAGMVVATYGVGWIAGQLLGGWTTDRFGPRTTLVTAMVAMSATLGALAVCHALPVLVITVAIAGLLNDTPRPVVGVVLADLVTDRAQLARMNGWRHFCQNLGYAVVGALGGLCWLSVGWTILVCLNAAAAAVFAALAAIALRTHRRPKRVALPKDGLREARTSSRLWLLLAVSLAGMTCNLSVVVSMPLLMSSKGLPASAFACVQVANALAVVLLTPLMNPVLSRLAARTGRMIATAGLSSLLLGVGMAAATLPDSVPGICVAVVACVPADIALLVSTNDIVCRIAPEPLLGRYNGMWGTTIAGASVLAPVLTAWSIPHGGAVTAAVTMFTVGLVGTLFAILLARSFRRTGRPRWTPVVP